MAFKAAPLNSAFMVTSIIGLLISIFYLPAVSQTWAFTFGILFFIMLIASIVSMTKATPDAQLLPRPKTR